MHKRRFNRSISPTSRAQRIFGWVLILCMTSAFFLFEEDHLNTIINFCLVTSYILIARASLKSVTVIRGLSSYLTPELLFLLFYFVLFLLPYQFYMLDMLSLQDSRFIRLTHPEQSQRAVLLATAGMVAFAIGIDGARSIDQVTNAPRLKMLFALNTARYIDLVALVLLIGSIGVYTAAGFQNVNETRYSGREAFGGAAANLYDVIILLSFIMIAQIVGAIRQRRLGIPLIIGMAVVALWSMRVLVSGDRNNFFLIAAAAVVAVSLYLVRIGRLTIILMVPLAIMLYNAIEVVRSQDDVSLSVIATEFISGSSERSERSDPRDSSFLNTTIALRGALGAVPEYVPHGYGLYEGIELMGIVPFIRGIVLPKDLRYTQTSTIQTEYILGPYSGWGLGTSVPADIYIDFGILGVIVIMFGIGRLACWIQQLAICHPDLPLPRILMVIIGAMYLEYPRYAAMFPIKFLVWATILVAVINYVVLRTGSFNVRFQPRCKEASRPGGFLVG